MAHDAEYMTLKLPIMLALEMLLLLKNSELTSKPHENQLLYLESRFITPRMLDCLQGPTQNLNLQIIGHLTREDLALHLHCYYSNPTGTLNSAS